MAASQPSKDQGWGGWWQGIHESVQESVRVSTKSLQDSVAKLTEPEAAAASESEGEELSEPPPVRALLRERVKPVAVALPDLLELLNSVLRKREEIALRLEEFVTGDVRPDDGDEEAEQLRERRRGPSTEELEAALLGESDGEPAAEESTPASRAGRALQLVVQRQPGCDPVFELSQGATTPRPALGTTSLGSGWLQATRQWVPEGKASDEGTAEFRYEAELGADDGSLPAAAMGILQAVWQCVEWLANDKNAKGRQLIKAFREVFPHYFRFLERLATLEKLKVKVDAVNAKDAWLCVSLPLNFAGMEKHYEHIARLARGLHSAAVVVKHPETGSTLAKLNKDDELVHFKVALREGRPAWAPAEGDFQPLAWTGELSASITLESTLRLMGFSSTALSLPTVQFLGTLRPNHLELSCTKVGDAAEDQAETLYLPKVAPQGELLRARPTPGEYQVTCAEGFEQVSFRKTKVWEDKAERFVADRAVLFGHDEGDGWVRFEVEKEWSLASLDLNKATWSAVESLAAAVVFDMARLRQLLQERFRFEVRHQPTEADAHAWLFQFGFQLAVPPPLPTGQTVGTHLVQSLRRHLRQLAIALLCRDLVEAVMLDTKALIEEGNEEDPSKAAAGAPASEAAPFDPPGRA